MELKQKKIVDGRFQLGIVTDWIYTKDLTNEETSLYITIARYCFQKYHRRSANIQLDKFKWNKNTLAKYRKSLTDKGLIRWTNTKAYTAYEIVEPKDVLDTFFFSGDIHYKTHTERPKENYLLQQETNKQVTIKQLFGGNK